MSITISILILTYNRVILSSNYIPKIVDKVGNIPFEVLLWDNGSIDGSYDWIYSYGNADCRVYKVYGATNNIGMEAFNTMATDARGKYILKVDDDIDVPNNFGRRLVEAYEKLNEKKLLFLGWDMGWSGQNSTGGSGTFATRSGIGMYQNAMGKIVPLGNSERALLCYNPRMWMMNGVCRLSPRKEFLDIGGHPGGIVYGVDYPMSCRAADHGYWIGYFNTSDLVYHRGNVDDPKYRMLKNAEMHKAQSVR